MVRLTYTRAEWAAIADLVAAAEPSAIPPGLGQRIQALLQAVPASWPNESCVLELEPANAIAVRRLVAQRHGVARAEEILHDHQRDNPAATHRIEHRTGGVSSVVAYLNDPFSLRQELMRHGDRLRAASATGEIVLVEQASEKELARLPLWPEPDAEDETSA